MGLPAMTSDTPDYGTLSGAEFLREVGVDPKKWAVAMFQAMDRFEVNADQMGIGEVGDQVRIDFLEAWLRDAMDAARKALPPIIDGAAG